MGADPQRTRAILEQRQYPVAGQAGGILGIVALVRESSAPAVQQVEAAAIGTDPEPPPAVFEQAGHAIGAQAPRFARSVAELLDAAIGLVEAAKFGQSRAAQPVKLSLAFTPSHK